MRRVFCILVEQRRLDHDAVHEAVLRALLAKRVPALIAALEARKEAQRVEGLRRAVRVVLESRGIAISEAAAGGIAACTDPATLDGWLHRAVSDAIEPLLRDISAYRPR